MPLKVRCPGCEKVLNVPDAARGKSVRCPKCETTIKIPTGQRKKRVVRQAAPESGDGILGLNLREAEDRHARICPVCGADATAEDVYCNECGVDLITGQIPEQERRRRQRGGPDPALFYKEMWGDSWRFMTKHKALAWRTFGYWIGFALLTGAFFALVLWCERMPPKVFAISFTVVMAMIFPGWIWSLSIKILLFTAAKKKKLDRINFDIFQNIALGVKWTLWAPLFFSPAVVVAAPFALLDQVALFAALGVACMVMLTGVPAAMAHMAMPISWKAWLSPTIMSLAFRNFGHGVYWTLLFLTVMGVCFSPLIATAAYYHAEISTLVSGGAIINPDMFYMIMAGAAAFSHLLFSFGALMLMRATGLYVYYNKPILELTTRIEEKKYVPKSLDEIESQPEGLTGKGVAMGLVLDLAFGCAFGLIVGTLGSDNASFLVNLGWGILFAGMGAIAVGYCMAIVASYQDSLVWSLLIFWFWLPAEFVYMGMNFGEMKWPVFIQVVGCVYVLIGFGMLGLGGAAMLA